MGYTVYEKALLDSDSSTKTVKISFPNMDIEDIETDRIYEQEMSVEEALCDSDDLVYGKCNVSVFKVKVTDFTDDVLNQEMSVEVSYHKDGLALEDKTEQVGKYIVSSMAKSSDRRYRIITAYDFMVKFDIDIAQWYKEVLFPDEATTRTVDEILQMLCSHCGVAYDSNYTLINGSVVVGRTVDPTTLKGRTLLECICEFNAVFGHVDPTGTLRFIALTPINNPEDVINTYKECTYEDYEVKPINCLQIKTEEDEIGVTVTTSSYSSANENMYVISGNILTYDLSSQNLNLVATRILDAIKDITYVPCSTTVKGHVYMSLGTPYSIVGRYDTVESYVTKRVISGIGSITTNLQSHGNALRDKESYRLIDEVKRIAGKAAKLRSDVDGISAELVDYEESSSTAIQATAEGLAAEIIRAQGAEGQLQTNIEATAESITQKVSNIKVGGRNLLLNTETKELTPNPSSGTKKPTINYQSAQIVSEWGATDAIRAYGSLAATATSIIFGALRNSSGQPNRDCVLGTPYVGSIYIKNNHATNLLRVNINYIDRVNPVTGVTDGGVFAHIYNPDSGEDTDITDVGASKFVVRPGKIVKVVLTGYGSNASGGAIRGLQIGFEAESTSVGEFDFTYWHPQIEEGNVATNWQPAPNDNARQSIVEQLADRLSLIISGESSSSVVILTQDALDAIVNNINLNGRVNFSGLNNSAKGRMSYYGTCSTSANTAEKAVAITGFTDEMLQAGTKISVYFSEGNSVNYATLKINSGTSKNIFAVNERLTSASRYNWLANSTVDFVYTGSVWRICDNNAGAIMDNIYVVGKTTINGGVIETKSVKAAQVDVVDLLAQEITSTGSIRGVTIISTETVNGVTYINTMAAGKNDIKTTNYLKSILSCGDFSGYASNELDASGVLKLYKGNVSKSGTMNDADARMTLLSPSSLYVGIDKDFRTEADIETGHIFGSIFGNRMAANAVVAKKSMVCGGFSVPNSCGSGNNKILSSTGTTEWTSLYSLSGLSSSGSLDLVTIGPESWHKFGELTLSKGKYVFVSTATLSAGPGNTYSDGFAGLGITTGSTTKTSFLQYDTKVNVKAGSVAIQNIRMLTCSSSTKVNVYGIQTIGTAISVTPGYMFLRMPG